MLKSESVKIATKVLWGQCILNGLRDCYLPLLPTSQIPSLIWSTEIAICLQSSQHLVLYPIFPIFQIYGIALGLDFKGWKLSPSPLGFFSRILNEGNKNFPIFQKVFFIAVRTHFLLTRKIFTASVSFQWKLYPSHSYFFSSRKCTVTANDFYDQ